MLPGIAGSLIASAFLEQMVADELGRTPDLTSRPRLTALQRVWRRAERLLGPASGARAVLDLLALPLLHLLDHQILHLEPFADGFVGVVGQGERPVGAVRTTPWNGDPGRAWRETVRASRTAGARWGIVCTGPRIRLIDAGRAWSRRALDFEMAAILTDERSAATLLTLLHASTLADDTGGGRLVRLVARSDAHGTAVCASLGAGVLQALTALVAALDRPDRRRTFPDPRTVFEQALTLVYRLLFLLYAEARSMMPTWHRVYRDAYSMEMLYRRCLRQPVAPGLWETLQAIARLAHAGCRAGDLVVTPFNGRLFAPRHAQLGDRTRLPDAVVAQAVRALATGPGESSQPIAYADLGVEQLGAVYESVLEYEPTRREPPDAAHARAPLVLTRTSGERKTTGSFYTPRAMTEFLVRRTLHPLVEGESSDRILSLRVVDPAMGSGAFLVAACRYLAAAAEQALAAEGRWRADDEHAAGERAALRRLVAQRCLFGVDLNPMAVQLARLSLWLTTLAGERPLTFLDHHLAAGNSLIGARFHDLARGWPGPRPRSDDGVALPLFGEDAAERMAARVLPGRFRLAREPGDSPAAVREKEGTLAALRAPGTPLAQWKAAADLWCAAWVWGRPTLSAGVFADVRSFLLGQGGGLPPGARAPIVARSTALAEAHRFFHWEIEFPEVFFDEQGRRQEDGGFDAVIGNPPWDVLRADSGTRQARSALRAANEPALAFFRQSGVYARRAGGHLNRYQLFVERACQLARRGGRLGLIVPSGLATDQGSGRLRQALMDTSCIDRVIGFDNRRGIFPIHRDVRFLLLTTTTGGHTERLAGSFGCSNTEWLADLPDNAREDPPAARPIVLTRSLIDRWDPEHRSWPLLRRPIDLEVLAHAAAHAPRLADAAGWGVRFGRELNATDDRRHFTVASSDGPPRAGTTGLRVIDGKHLEPFRLKPDTGGCTIAPSTAAALVDPSSTFGRTRLGYRDVASATNRLTLIAALLPPRVISTHTVFCLKTPLGAASQYCLLALLNSLVVNYLVRLQVTTHVTTALVARLPVPRPSGRSGPFRDLAALARRLERRGLADLASYARLNAIVAQLYALTPAHYAHVVDSFPLLGEEVRAACGRAFAARNPGRARD